MAKRTATSYYMRVIHRYLGFWQGYLLEDADNFLTHGTNKKTFYKIYQSIEDIEEAAIRKLLAEAITLDAAF